MAIRTKQIEQNVIYFCTITCYNWLPLFEITNFYDHIYNWFSILKGKQVKIIGYVIIPNHLHLLLYIPENSKNINQVLSTAKRFMAYDIVTRLKKQRQEKILNNLKSGVQYNEIKKRKIHQVFQPSFDIKPCYSEKFIIQKLDYIHHNPVIGKWSLADDYAFYPHSSAGFYILNNESDFVTHYRDLV